MNSSWGLSILIHLALISPVVVLSVFNFDQKTANTLIEVDWLPPQQTVTEVKTTPTVPQDIQQRKETVVPTRPVERVFGVDTKSLRSDEAENLVLKEGNTIAKEVDNTKLTDQTPLPTPQPEFLVTQMPVLKSKPEIPYPPDARKKEIEGKVILNVLIDEKGIVRKADLVTGPGFGLNEVALEKIFQFTFQPAKIGEQNVPVQIRYAVTFQLRS